ncbi:MAG TPA: hypothetical protein VI815_01710 [Candidatus Nanoarchaeia archaeon]|nr:hypothetical protein [Candidatus Nanoarchaeia archaeon]
MKNKNKISLTKIITTSALIGASLVLAAASYRDYIQPINEVNYQDADGSLDYQNYYNDLNSNHNKVLTEACISGLFFSLGALYIQYHREMRVAEEKN